MEITGCKQRRVGEILSQYKAMGKIPKPKSRNIVISTKFCTAKTLNIA
jgi:hypothetical protein